MIKKHHAIAFAACMTLTAASPTWGDSVYAKGDIALFANDDLIVLDISDPDDPKTLANIEVGGASEVTVSECLAVVTKSDESGKDVDVIDLEDISEVPESFCDDDDSEEDEECVATFDPTKNILTIPCVEAFGSMYTARMTQRGNSSNWEVIFLREKDD